MSGVLKDISEFGFSWRECCEERDNDIMSDTSLLVIHEWPIKTNCITTQQKSFHKLDYEKMVSFLV